MSKADFNEGFDNGIMTALALMNGHGDCGSTQYEELLALAGEERIIKAASKNGGSDMHWTGLDHYLARKNEWSDAE